LQVYFSKMKKTSKQILQRHLAGALACLISFLQISPCLIITGCYKNHDTKKTETPTTVIPRTAPTAQVKATNQNGQSEIEEEQASATSSLSSDNPLLESFDDDQGENSNTNAQNLEIADTSTSSERGADETVIPRTAPTAQVNATNQNEPSGIEKEQASATSSLSSANLLLESFDDDQEENSNTNAQKLEIADTSTSSERDADETVIPRTVPTAQVNATNQNEQSGIEADTPASSKVGVGRCVSYLGLGVGVSYLGNIVRLLNKAEKREAKEEAKERVKEEAKKRSCEEAIEAVRNAPQKSLRHVYRQGALTYCPDRGGSDEAFGKFLDIDDLSKQGFRNYYVFEDPHDYLAESNTCLEKQKWRIESKVWEELTKEPSPNSTKLQEVSKYQGDLQSNKTDLIHKTWEDNNFWNCFQSTENELKQIEAGGNETLSEFYEITNPFKKNVSKYRDEKRGYAPNLTDYNGALNDNAGGLWSLPSIKNFPLRMVTGLGVVWIVYRKYGKIKTLITALTAAADTITAVGPEGIRDNSEASVGQREGIHERTANETTAESTTNGGDQIVGGDNTSLELVPQSASFCNASEAPVRSTTISPSDALANADMCAVTETVSLQESGVTSETGDVTRPASFSEEEGHQTMDEDDASYNVVHQSAFSGNADEAPVRSTTVAPSEPLTSADMRTVIDTFHFKESRDIFETGCVERSVFFYKEEDDENSTKRTYIALAHNKKPNHSKAQRSGEQSIQIVLRQIKDHLSDRSNQGTTNIFIPLQGIINKHWTLLAITLKPSGTPDSNKLSVTATHYDPKGRLSASYVKNAVTSYAPERIKNAVERYFHTKTVNYEYLGTQGLLDHHNCGRYVLLKLGELLKLDTAPKTIEDINKILSPEVEVAVNNDSVSQVSVLSSEESEEIDQSATCQDDDRS
jgi:hypothetical protein